MSHSVQMPALGESVTEGTVTRWLKNEGDQVTEDEPLLEVSTDKVDTEVPAPYSGVLERILVHEDETVGIGAELAIIGDGSGGGTPDAGGEVAEPARAEEQAAPSSESEPETKPAPEAAPEPEPAPEPEAAPRSEHPGEAPSTETERPAEAPRAGQQSSGGADAGQASGTEVTMPAMGESVTEGTVTRWLKQVGDAVEVDEPLLEISTDKVDTEMPSPVGGTLLQILAQEDQTVEVGAPLAVIGQAGAAQAQPAPEQPEAAAAQETPAEAASEPEPEPEPKSTAAAETEARPTEAAPEPAPARPAHARTEQEAGSAAATQAAPPAAPRASAPSWQPAAPASRAGMYVTPVVRKLAADSGVDLSTVTGTGVGGRIRREDVLAAAEQQRAAAAAAASAPTGTAASGSAAAPAGASSVTPSAEAAALIGTTQPTPRIRQSIARNMLTAMTTSAQLTTVIEVDVTRVAALRQRAKAAFEAREGVKLSFLPFFVKAAVEAAKVYPIINSSLSEDLKQITYHPAVNMGIAVDTPRGLIVPVIKNADDLNIGGIARRIADLADRTRENKIGPDELSGGTLTLTNTGSVGALFDTAIFVPPQSAIVVTGAVVKRPVVVTDADGNDVIAVRSMAYVALSYDHRTIDGADAARYLAAIKKRIEGGDFEADLGL